MEGGQLLDEFGRTMIDAFHYSIKPFEFYMVMAMVAAGYVALVVPDISKEEKGWIRWTAVVVMLHFVGSLLYTFKCYYS